MLLRAPGYFGKKAAVAYFDFGKDKYCLTDKYHHDEYIGCFADEDLHVDMIRLRKLCCFDSMLRGASFH